ncbi:MAG: polysaccharide deacetylase family protein [Nitrospira sp.]|nr:polysaccharide deacetylase family protein [Nitrospira sp.]MCP9441207.1 polysaccharide deacetylase family protein [Nitrospira sp.]
MGHLFFGQAGQSEREPITRTFHFTIDCDWVPGSQAGLERLLALCEKHRLTGTIFFAGRFAESYPDLVRDCLRRGHELGAHGWAHGSLEEDEDFRLASYEQQREWIRLATDAIEEAAGIRPVIFRAPNLRIGETTLRVLAEEGYRFDSSIPARRFDMGFGRVHYTDYFWAPLAPYCPSPHDLSRPGYGPIVEIPPSACLFPINLAALRVLGLPALKSMIRWISQRSPHLLFYCHPFEVLHAKDQQFPTNMSKWNQWGMSPANLQLMDALLDHLLPLGYTPTAMCTTVPSRPLPKNFTVPAASLHACCLERRNKK